MEAAALTGMNDHERAHTLWCGLVGLGLSHFQSALDTGSLIHKSQSGCEAAALDARFATTNALWVCIVTFDLPSFAGSASST